MPTSLTDFIDPTGGDRLDVGDARIALLIAADPAERTAATHAVVRAWGARHPDAAVVALPPAATWPFTHPLVPLLPERASVLWVADVHEAFVNRQTAGTRLVTTHPLYLLEEWRVALADRADVLLVCTADPHVLAEHAPDVLARRGGYAEVFVHHVDGPPAPSPAAPASPGVMDGQMAQLAAAFRERDPAARLAACVAALEEGRRVGALVATASTCMEVNDLEAAARDLDEALGEAPEWAAAHFERGKLWLRVDDMEAAARAFRLATDRLPRFGAAWANLGATLGELDRPAEALAAFQHALAADPASHQALNNIGVVSRELGRLTESEAAFKRVIALVPDLAFGHYNLGHTLFLQGRYQAALGAYLEGQRRDPERNPVQASRVALCRLATGDAEGALRDLQQATTGLPTDYRQQLLGDTSAVAWALLTHKPDLPGWKLVNDWLTRELRG